MDTENQALEKNAIRSLPCTLAGKNRRAPDIRPKAQTYLAFVLLLTAIYIMSFRYVSRTIGMTLRII
jgi:hypothetical protein